MSFTPYDRPIRAAFIGLGRIYDLNVRAYRDNPDVEVVALVDPSEERRAERRLVGEYEAVIDEIVGRLAPANHADAVEIAALPLEIRGFGHIKDANLARAKAKEAALLTRLRGPETVTAPALAAAE